MKKTAEIRLTRKEVPTDLTWNLDDLFSSEKQWEAELELIEKEIAAFDFYKGSLHKGSKVLLDCLSAQEQLSMKVVKAATFASLRQSTDGTDPINQANSAKVSSLRTKIDCSFIIHSF